MSSIALRLPIIERADLTQSVDARNLHGWLEVGRDFSNWVKSRISELDLVEGVDFQKLNDSASPNLASNRVDYALSLDAAKHLAMVERNERGREARAYFIAAEKRLRAIDYSDPRVVLRVLEAQTAKVAELQMSNAQLRHETEFEIAARRTAEAKLAELDGAVALHERTERAKGLHGFREAAKMIGASPGDFVAFLTKEGYAHRLGKRKRLAANEYFIRLAKPLFFTAHDELNDNRGEVIRTHRTWITDHGVEVLAGRFREWKSRAA